MLDPQDEAFDHRLATHLVSLYHQSKEMAEEEDLVSCLVKSSLKWEHWPLLCALCTLHPPQDMATLKDYIAFARMHIHPELSEEAAQSLVQAYVGQWAAAAWWWSGSACGSVR